MAAYEDLQSKQWYLNRKLGTAGLTTQQCLQRLAGAVGSLASNPMTTQDAANNYAGSNLRRTIEGALKAKGGAATKDVEITTQQAARRL